MGHIYSYIGPYYIALVTPHKLIVVTSYATVDMSDLVNRSYVPLEQTR